MGCIKMKLWRGCSKVGNNAAPHLYEVALYVGKKRVDELVDIIKKL